MLCVSPRIVEGWSVLGVKSSYYQGLFCGVC